MKRPRGGEDGVAAVGLAREEVEVPRHVFLLCGQSNMAGRGVVEAAWEDDRVWMWRDGWRLARDPLHVDKPGKAGVGPGLAFARSVVDLLDDGSDDGTASRSAVIGLIPAAFGGSAVARWQPGADLFEAALAAVRASGAHLAGILWHQGESDASAESFSNPKEEEEEEEDDDDAPSYRAQLATAVEALQAACGRPPMVLGEVGRFLDVADERFSAAARVNVAIARVAASLPRTAVASSKGLAHKGDRLHFSAEAATQLGRRYAILWLGLADKNQSSRVACLHFLLRDPTALDFSLVANDDNDDDVEAAAEVPTAQRAMVD